MADPHFLRQEVKIKLLCIRVTFLKWFICFLGRGHHGPPGGNAWGGPPQMENEEDMHFMGNGGGPPMQPIEDDMRMDGSGYPPPPINDRHEGNYGWGHNNFRGGGGEPGPYDRGDEDYSGRGPPGPGHFAPNYPGQFHPIPPHHQPPPGRWNPDGGGRGGYGRGVGGGGGGRRGRRGGYNNY